MMNRYKYMIALQGDDPGELLSQIKAIPHVFSIHSMYAMDGVHYAYLNFDKPVNIRVKRPEKSKKNLDQLQKEINSKEK